MRIEDFKDRLGDDYAALETYVTDLIGQRDAARKESADGRKALKTKAETAEALNRQLMEKLGIETAEELDALPPAKGQAEAQKQLETRLKKFDADLKAKDQALADLSTRYRQSRLEAALGQALGAHDFIDAELIANYLQTRVEWDGDDPRISWGNSAPLALPEAVAHLAQSKPHLLKAAAARGSGYNPTARGGEVKNPWAKDSFNLTEQLRLGADNPTLASQLKTQAGVA